MSKIRTSTIVLAGILCFCVVLAACNNPTVDTGGLSEGIISSQGAENSGVSGGEQESSGTQESSLPAGSQGSSVSQGSAGSQGGQTSQTAGAGSSVDGGSSSAAGSEFPGPTVTQTPFDGPEKYNGRTFDDALVSIVQSTNRSKAEDLTQADIDKLVRDAVNAAGGFNGLITEGDTVVLKPNLVTTRDYTLPKWQGEPTKPEVNGNTTDYRFVRAVAKLVREHNTSSGKIYVMEGSSEPTAEAFVKMKYTKEFIPEVDDFLAIESVSGGWREYSSDLLAKVTLSDPQYIDEYYWNRLMYEADCLITLPTLKNHWDAVVTGGVKNIGIGATPANVYANDEAAYNKGNMSRNNMVDHGTLNLHRWIADYYTCRPADFSVVDGLQGLENGPTPCYEVAGSIGGIEDSQKNLRLVLAGRDAVAVDTVSANIMNWDPSSVMYLKYLNDSGVGIGDARRITIAGNRSVAQVRTDFAGVVLNRSVKGRTITDMVPPALRNLKAEFNGQELAVSYETNSDSVKVEILANGKLVWKNTSGSLNTAFDVSGLAKGSYEIKVVSTDKFFNSSELKVNAVKESGMLYGDDGSYRASYAAVAPVINGVSNDGIWSKAYWAPIDQLWLGSQPYAADFSGRYKMLWSEDMVYILAEIADDKFVDKYADPLNNYYNDDCLEFFIDEDGSGGDHERSYNAFAYHVSMFGDVVDMNRSGVARLYNDHVVSAVKYDSASQRYIWELGVKAFPSSYSDMVSDKPVSLASGKVMGFALAYCDADGNGTREHFMGSVPIAGSNKNIAWQTADVFGDLILVR